MEYRQVGQRKTKVVFETYEVTDLNQTYCPYCHTGPLVGLTGAEIRHNDEDGENKDKRIFPQEGSPTICGFCGEILIFHLVDKILSLSKPTVSDLNYLKSHSQMWELISGLQQKIKNEQTKLKRF